MTGGKIEIIGLVTHIRYYKNGWGIIEVQVDEIQKGTPITDKYNHLVLKGTMPQVQIGGRYVIEAEYTVDDKWGEQYNVLKLYTFFNTETADDKAKKQFLLSIFTDKQVEAMYEALKDPFDT